MGGTWLKAGPAHRRQLLLWGASVSRSWTSVWSWAAILLLHPLAAGSSCACIFSVKELSICSALSLYTTINLHQAACSFLWQACRWGLLSCFFPQTTILSCSSRSLFSLSPPFKRKPQGIDQLSDTILSDVLCGATPVGCFPMSMSNYGAVLVRCKCLSLMSP